MKHYLLLLLLLLGLGTAQAQQLQEEQRSERQLVFADFRDAKVLQTFGRLVKAKANILYKNAALCYVDEKDGKVYQASNASIIGVVFDSIRYQKVDKVAMGRVVAERGANSLLCVTTIDMEKYKEITGGSTDLPFVSLDLGGLARETFIDMSGGEQQSNKGYPLKHTYYFSLKGRIVPAREKTIKKEVKPDMKLAFKNLMEDRWWSWNDVPSLKQLFLYFPE